MFKKFLTTCAIIATIFNVPFKAYGQVSDIVLKESGKGRYDEDYFVALKAYEDGFYDVAKLSLSEFLKKDSTSTQAGFATYLLYQIYMQEGDYKTAKLEFDKLKTFDDTRFDKNKMSSDEVIIATQLDCKDAKKMVLSEVSDIKLKAFLTSNCEVTRDVVDYVAAMPFSTESLITVIDKIKDDKERMLSVYNNLSSEKRTAKLLNFYGHYFASNKMFTDFWRLYSEYKDAELVSIALDDVWNTGDYNRYVDFFDKNAQNYQLNNVSYCRLIEASNKTSKSFDCNVVDGCLGVSNPQYKKTKLACYMKNEDKPGIAGFMKNITLADGADLCEYGAYIVAKNLYSADFLSKFSTCSNKGGMYETLITNKDYNAITNLAGKKTEQTDLAYLTLAAYFSGKKTDSDAYFKNLTDPDLINMVKSRIGSIK